MGLFWLVLLGLIVWLVSRLLPGSGSGTTRTAGESALEILDRRWPARQTVTAVRRPHTWHRTFIAREDS